MNRFTDAGTDSPSIRQTTPRLLELFEKDEFAVFLDSDGQIRLFFRDERQPAATSGSGPRLPRS